MVTKKDLIIAVLATFCLTATLFMISTTKSQTEQYDAWADLNGDGKIDILDVVGMTSIYATTGNPTKNVNVTNFPLDENGNLRINITENTKEWYRSMTVQAHDVNSIIDMTAGYRQITFCVYTFDGPCEVYVWWQTRYYSTLYSESHFSLPINTQLCKNYDVKGSQIQLYISNSNNFAIVVYFSLFMTT